MDPDFLKRVALTQKELHAFRAADCNGQRERVKGHYEETWGGRLDGIRQKLEGGESLANVIFSMRLPPHRLVKESPVVAPVTAELRSRRGFDPEAVPSPVRAVASEAGYQLVVNFSPLPELLRVATEARYIAELGSGIGWNLFELAILLGRAAHGKRFFALEYTDAGREVSALLASHCDSPPLASHFFDYTAPDLSMVPDDAPALFFSQHSIEQVEDISDTMYRQLVRRKSPTTVIHIEPIGWQRFPQLLGPRLQEDEAYLQSLIAHRLDMDNDGGKVAVLAAIYSWRNRFNRNAFSLLTRYIGKGVLSLDEAVFDFTWGRNTNIVNPSTFLRLTVARRKRRASPGG